MYSKGIMALMLVLVFIIPGGYGISVTMYGEDGGNSFYDATTYAALVSRQDNSVVKYI
jgi:hypothetical protein